MPTVTVEAHLSSQELLNAVQQLDLQELEHFVADVVALRARRVAPCLGKSESDLLLRINQTLPEDVRQRYATLMAKRDAETLTPDEYQELLRLTTQFENANVERVRCLSELAQLRGTSLKALMKTLGIPAPTND